MLDLAQSSQHVIVSTEQQVVQVGCECVVVDVVCPVQSIVVTAPQSHVTVVSGGVRGPRGPAGDESYIHTQSVPSATWEITHNLGQFPAVTVVDSAGSVILGDVEYLSDSAVRITFAAPFGGVAYLN